jgi:hypothetical protein
LAGIDTPETRTLLAYKEQMALFTMIKGIARSVFPDARVRPGGPSAVLQNLGDDRPKDDPRLHVVGGQTIRPSGRISPALRQKASTFQELVGVRYSRSLKVSWVAKHFSNNSKNGVPLVLLLP